MAGTADPSGESNSWLGGLSRLLRDNLPGVAFGDGVEQAWALDIPVAEVDLVVQTLDAQGFFAEVTPAAEFASPATSPLLAARINGLRVEKRWGSTAELETLIARVRREGKLVSHLQNVERIKVESPEPASVLLRLPQVVDAPQNR